MPSPASPNAGPTRFRSSWSPARSTRRRSIASAATTTRSTSSASSSRRPNGAAPCAAVERDPGFVASAFQAMTTGRPRPAALFLPQDLMRRRVLRTRCVRSTSNRPSLAAPSATRSRRPPSCSHRGQRPIILAGGGALWSGAADAIEALAARLGAPVVTTLNGKGLLDERHPLSLGHARSARAKTCSRTPTSCSPSAAASPKS